IPPKRAARACPQGAPRPWGGPAGAATSRHPHDGDNLTDALAPDLAGKSILITGASTGIGAAAARAFARFGCKVAIHYNASRNRAEEVAADVRLAGGQAHLVGGDFTDSATVRRVIDDAAGAMGGIDILVNNAGGLVRRVPIAEVDDAFFDEVIDLNVRS